MLCVIVKIYDYNHYTLSQSNFLQHCADQSHRQKVMEKNGELTSNRVSVLLHIWKKREKGKDKAHQKQLSHHEKGRVNRVNAELFRYKHN